MRAMLEKVVEGVRLSDTNLSVEILRDEILGLPQTTTYVTIPMDYWSQAIRMSEPPSSAGAGSSRDAITVSRRQEAPEADDEVICLDEHREAAGSESSSPPLEDLPDSDA